MAKFQKVKTVRGVLDPYFETGTEGVCWAVIEEGVSGYESLNVMGFSLEERFRLKIFLESGDGQFKNKVFDDHLLFLPSFFGSAHPYFKKHLQTWPSGLGQQFVLRNMWIHDLPLNIDLGFWEALMFDKFPHRVELTIERAVQETKKPRKKAAPKKNKSRQNKT